MPVDLTNDKSTLVQAMAWCHQVTSHYLSQCWPRSLSPYGISRSQWVNPLKAGTRIFWVNKYWLCRIMNPCIPQDRVSVTCVITLVSNDKKYKYISMFHKRYSARRESNHVQVFANDGSDPWEMNMSQLLVQYKTRNNLCKAEQKWYWSLVSAHLFK